MTREQARAQLAGTWSFTARNGNILVSELLLLEDIAEHEGKKVRDYAVPANSPGLAARRRHWTGGSYGVA